MIGLFSDLSPTEARIGGLDTALLHRLQCKACPLAKVACKSPNMPATGAKKPLVYVLGEAPGATEDMRNEQFVGESGRLLRSNIPERFKGRLRFNNTVRCRPPDNRTPTEIEVECCRPSIVSDIEATKPVAIFGFGNVPLEWVTHGGYNGITLWRGRRMPVKVGNHTCWYYPLFHPSFILHLRSQRPDSEEERVFKRDLKRAFAEVENLPAAEVHNRERAVEGIELITAGGTKGLKQLKEALAWAVQQPLVGLDYETNGLRPYKAGAKVLTAALGTEERSFAFGIQHPEAPWSKTELPEVIALWKNFLAKAKGVKTVHNLAFEMEWTGVMYGAEYLRASKWDDTMTLGRILDERRGGLSLEFLVQQHFGFNLKALSQLDRSKLEEYSLEVVLHYNALDAKYHALLREELYRRVKAEDLLEAHHHGLRRVPTVVLSQMKGLPVDQAEVLKLYDKYDKRLKEGRKKVSAISVVKEFERRTGQKFNPLSTHDVLRLLRDVLKRKEVFVTDKYSKQEKLSADEKVLTAIAEKGGDEGFSKAIIALRKDNKRMSTYIEPMLASVEGSLIYPDGLLHTQFNTNFTRTGRLSSDSPNLQNYPKRNDEAKEVRRPIAAPPGCVAMAFDFGQLEARVIAMFTRDKTFCKALWERYDVHQEWAERIARSYPDRIGGKKNLTDKKVMKDFRTDIKNQWTFPLFFGAQLKSAAGYLKIPEYVIKKHYNEFWKQFSGVKAWQENLLGFYRANGYVECLTGLRRYGPLSVNKVYNTPVQGTAAELVMDAMGRLSETGDPVLQPEINIHDDLTFLRVPEKQAEEVAEKIITEMLRFPDFPWINVPMTVEMSMGKNWLELEEFGTFSSDTWFKR